jgi:hypothetical protein
MKRSKDNPNQLPQHDYELALQTAVSWLGERYLLAEPVAKRNSSYQPFFAGQRNWHDVPRAAGPVSRKH